jgi:hypothetical protein
MHRVVEDESGPVVAGVVVSAHGMDVYFQLIDQGYFLVVCVTVDDAGPSVAFAGQRQSAACIWG